MIPVALLLHPKRKSAEQLQSRTNGAERDAANAGQRQGGDAGGGKSEG
jgi:hypothetical protein